jgi:hypothetical protein
MDIKAVLLLFLLLFLCPCPSESDRRMAKCLVWKTENKVPALLFGSLASAKPDIPLREKEQHTHFNQPRQSVRRKTRVEIYQVIIEFVVMYSMQAFDPMPSPLHHPSSERKPLYTLLPMNPFPLNASILLNDIRCY